MVERDGQATGRRAIILIPGLEEAEKSEKRDLLVANLVTIEGHRLRVDGTVQVGAEAGVRLRAEPLRGDVDAVARELDVFEAYWTDMTVKSQEQGLKHKLRLGFSLLFFWVFSYRFWGAFSISRWMTLGMLASGGLMCLWFLSLAVLAANALSVQDLVPAELQSSPTVTKGVTWAKETLGSVASTEFWGVITLLLAMVPVETGIKIAAFTKHYLQDVPDETGVGLRARIRSRVTAVIEEVSKSEEYDEIFVTGHSFGTVIATDILADWPHEADRARVTFVTWGSPMAMLQFRSVWLRDQLAAIARPGAVARWCDFWSPTDWLCSRVPVEQGGAVELSSRRLAFEAPFHQRLTGETHKLYYKEQAVLEFLAAPLPLVAEEGVAEA